MGEHVARTKDQILTMLLKNMNAFVSGQAICDRLGCSRTAVWKHIQELQKEGYIIESVPRRGYRLVQRPDRLSEAEIKAGLKCQVFGRTIIYKESVVSTQKIAHFLAEDGAEEGTLVVSDEQTGGRGRLGRTWHSPKGSGIWMSLILRPALPFHRTPPLTLMAAVAVVRAIHAATGLRCAIKWPNDVLYEGKKLVGILTEMQAEENRVRAVIIGIGMNVNTPSDAFPEELKETATSLKIITGKAYARAELIQAILFELESLYHLYLTEGFRAIKLMWESYSTSLGKRIRARTAHGDVVTGVAKGITDDGVLLVEGDDGRVHPIYSADIDL